jgi:hypothetical protein
MTAHPFLFAVSSLLACACSLPRLHASTSAPQASDFEAAIARIARTDAESPAVLSAQLAYADFLLGAAPGPCAQRLERVQEQLGSVDANPKTRVLFPEGWARPADLEYRLYLARAACGSETDRETELRIALTAARRAVELYRSAFDYRSMVIMQFDVAMTLRQLGENTAAVAALRAALDMDREYGFSDDARENYKLLLTWSGKEADDAQIARLLQDFPKRRAVLTFAWHPSDARITFESQRERLDDGRIVASRAAASFERRVAPSKDGGWSVSYADRLTRYEPGVWPTAQGSQGPQEVFAPALLPTLGFGVSAAGEFAGVTDSTGFAARLAARTVELIRAGAPSGDRARSLMREAVGATDADLSPGMLEAATAESYRLETAMWIGATLDQGVWYEVSAPLALPGMPRVVVQNRIQFAFTRMVPCNAGAGLESCVEIVYRATPDQAALDNVMADMGLSGSPFTGYTASTEGRIVTDPATLMSYACEEWVHWYASLGRSAKDKVLQSEHLVSATTYAAAQLRLDKSRITPRSAPARASAR